MMCSVYWTASSILWLSRNVKMMVYAVKWWYSSLFDISLHSGCGIMAKSQEWRYVLGYEKLFY